MESNMDLSGIAETTLEQHDFEDLTSTIYCFDALGKPIVTVNGLDIGVVTARGVFRLGNTIRAVAYVGMIHGRAMPNHQTRSSWINIPTQERKGYVVRQKDGGRQQLIVSDILAKDANVFERMQSSKKEEV